MTARARDSFFGIRRRELEELVRYHKKDNTSPYLKLRRNQRQDLYRHVVTDEWTSALEYSRFDSPKTRRQVTQNWALLRRIKSILDKRLPGKRFRLNRDASFQYHEWYARVASQKLRLLTWDGQRRKAPVLP